MKMIDVTKKLNVDKVEIIAAGVDHAEGITITPDMTIYCGGEAGQIYRIDNDVPVEVANIHGFMLGLASDLENRVYAIDNGNKCVWRYDPKTGKTDKWLEGSIGNPLNVPNHGAFGPDGSYYLTDSGDWDQRDGKVWVKRPGRELEIFTNEATNFPNGNAVSLDGKKLYVLESVPSAICEFEIREDGSAGPKKVLTELDWLVPDGIRVAADGSLIVSFYSPNLVTRWSPDSGLVALANDPQCVFLAAPTNFEFCGDNLETMIFTSLARWQLSRVKLGIKGARPHFPSAELIGN
jgi:gluconolactonase